MMDANVGLPPLHTQDPQGRFSNRAEDYAQYRPRYPQTALATLLDSLATPAELIIADVGAGTGISSRLLADSGATVWAIEPNAAMRDQSETHPNITFYGTSAEATGLPNQSVDLVTCFQAFHWFEPIAALIEFHRILKPGGRIALVWNERDMSNPLMVEYSDIIRTASETGLFDRCDRRSPDALVNSPLFTNFRTHTFTYQHPLHLDGLVGLTASASYVTKTGAVYEQLTANLQALYQRWESETGAIALSYQTNVYLADAV